MTNAELIKALRTCADHNAVGDKCYGECPYNGNYNECVDQMILDAAAALEAADKRITELENSYEWKAYAALEESIEGYKTRIEELEAQMPKEGEWIESEDLESALKGKVVCSNCGEPQFALELTNEFIRMKNQKTNYCPNCGAKMRGEYDEH